MLPRFRPAAAAAAAAVRTAVGTAPAVQSSSRAARSRGRGRVGPSSAAPCRPVNSPSSSSSRIGGGGGSRRRATRGAASQPAAAGGGAAGGAGCGVHAPGAAATLAPHQPAGRGVRRGCWRARAAVRALQPSGCASARGRSTWPGLASGREWQPAGSSSSRQAGMLAGLHGWPPRLQCGAVQYGTCTRALTPAVLKFAARFVEGPPPAALRAHAESELPAQRWRHVGGLPPPLWQHAPPLGEVRARLAALLAGRILVGHHLSKDLAALALAHPASDVRDTLRYRQAAVRALLCGTVVGAPALCLAPCAAPALHAMCPSSSVPAAHSAARGAARRLAWQCRELQGRRGAGRKLRQLSAEKLGRDIQRSGRRHSPRRAGLSSVPWCSAGFRPAMGRWHLVQQ